jgi:pimeloyl-ACP methyl ester carboxylesterase
MPEIERIVIRGAGENGPALEMLAAGPWDATACPILLLHGAYTGAWIWAENVLPWLARLGRRAYALNFRAHGGSGGRARLRRTGIADYVLDALTALRAIGGPVIVAGHSLGGFVAQHLLADAEIAGRLRGLALIATVPTEGMGSSSAWLAMSDPPLFRSLMQASQGFQLDEETARRALFSPDTPLPIVIRCCRSMQAESPVALAQAQFPVLAPSAACRAVPALVLAGREDRLIRGDAALRTALWHGARFAVASGPHIQLLGKEWTGLADELRSWLQELEQS